MNTTMVDAFLRAIEDVEQRIARQERRLGPRDADVVALRLDLELLRANVARDVERLRVRDASAGGRVH
jgi:uncharacterized coiled-coil protein SlyX